MTENFNDPDIPVKIDNKMASNNELITKFLTKGIKSFSPQDLLITIASPNYSKEFRKKTGIDWDAKYQNVVLESLKNQNYNINVSYWKNSSSVDVNISKEFFKSIINGNLRNLKQYFKNYGDNNLLKIKDDNNMTPLHWAFKVGNQEIAEYLINKGFLKNARDKWMRTPAHLACLSGSGKLLDTILNPFNQTIEEKTNTNKYLVKDIQGRSLLHFSCCSNSIEGIIYIWSHCPELISSTDNEGLSALHYSIFNDSECQIEIIKLLLDMGIDINITDNNNKTCLHYAAEYGKKRCIPILVEKGSDLLIREKKSKKTAIEWSKNERIKELIILYKNGDPKTYKVDLDFLDNAIKGKSVKIKKQNLFQTEKLEKIKNVKKNNEYEEVKHSQFISPFNRNNLIKYMRILQEHGIRSYQHIIRPYLYTGSWLEGINSVEQLYERLKDLTACESAIRVFNLLFPYDGELPKDNNKEVAMSNFFGQYFEFEKSKENNSNLDSAKKFSETMNLKMNEENQKLSDKLKNSNIEIKKLQDDLNFQKDQYEKIYKEYQNVKQLEFKNKDLLSKNDSLKQENNLLYDKEKKLAEKINLLNVDLSKFKENNLKADWEIQNLKKLLNANNNIKKKNVNNDVKLMTPIDRKNLLNKNFNFSEDEAIGNLSSACSKREGTLKEQLKKHDKDVDERLNKMEFITFLKELNLKSNSTKILIDIFQLSKGIDEVYIDDIVNIVKKRAKIFYEEEKRLLTIFLNSFTKNGSNVKENFSKFDTDGDDSLNINELKQIIIDLNIKIPDDDIYKLFSILDEDNSNSISLAELELKLRAFENVLNLKDNLIENKIEDVRNEILPQKKLNFKQIPGIELAINNALDEVNKDDNVENLNLEFIIGELKCQMFKLVSEVNNISNLKILIRLAGHSVNYIEKIVDIEKISEFKVAFRIPLIELYKESLSNHLEIKLVELKENNIWSILGENKIQWKGCLKLINQGKWGYNKDINLGKSKIKLQIKWIPSTSKEFKSNIKNTLYTSLNFTSNINRKGILKVLFLSLVYTEIQKSTIVEINLDKKTEKIKGNEFILKDKNINSINKEFEFPIDVKSGQNINCISLSVKNNKKLISKVYINYLECLNFDKEWSEHKAFPLFNENMTQRKSEKLYLKTYFISKEDENIVEEEDNIEKGVLKVFLVKVEDVPGDDGFGKKKTSDPYIEFEFKDSKNKIIKAKSSKKSENLNPEYYELFNMFLNFKKVGTIPPLTIKLLDYDITGDDLLGTYNLNLDNLTKKFCSWEKFELSMNLEKEYLSQNKNTKLFLELYYVPEGEFDENPAPPSEKPKNQYINLKGQLYLNLISIQNIIILNKNNIKEDFGKKNFFIKISLEKNKFQSKVFKNNKNQLIDFNSILKLEFPNEENIKKVNIEIYEKKGLLSSNKLVSTLELDWSELLKNKGNWAINKIFEIKGNDEILYKNKVKNMGEIYVQSKFVQEGMVDSKELPEFILDKTLFENKSDDVKGELEIKLIHCKDLFKADSGLSGSLSDPYVIFKIKDKKNITSNVIKNTLNPLYNSIYRTNFIYKEKEMDKTNTKINIEVYDKDYGLNSDDLLGFLEIDFKECIKNPNEWSINKIYNLNFTNNLIKEQTHLNSKYIEDLLNKENNLGPQIYLQIRYVTDRKIKVLDVPLLEDINQTILENKREGTISIFISHAIGLIKSDSGLEGSLSDPYCKIILPNKQEMKCKEIKNTINPHFKQLWFKDFSFEDIRHLKKGKVIIYDKDRFSADDSIGECEIDFTNIFKKENFNNWAIEDRFILKNNEIEKKKKLKSLGYVYLMLKFIPEKLNLKKLNESEFLPKQIKEDYIKIMDEANYKGKLVFFISHAKGIMKGDSSLFSSKKSSDPFVEVFLPNNKKFKTKYKNKTTIPIWEEKFERDIELNIFNRPIVKFEVKDHDFILPNDLLGTCELELDECLKNKNKWYDYILKLDGKKEFKKFQKFGDICIQIIFVDDGLEIPTKPSPKEDILKVKKECTEIGTLFANISHAKNLPIKDFKSSDPYVIINYPDKSTKKTKYIKNCLNPVFDQLIEKEIEIENFQIEDLLIEVYDHDIGSPDDFIGYFMISLEEVIKNPNKWFINQNYELNLEKMKDTEISENKEKTEIEDKENIKKFKPEVYIQIGYVPKDGPKLEKIKPNEDITKYLEMNSIKGKLKLNLIHCCNLIPKDGETSDPLVKFKLGKIEKKSNENISKTINPIFNDKLEFDINYENEQNLDLLKINVFDKNFFKNSNIGFVNFNLLETIQNENKWFFNGSLPLENGDKGEIYWQIGFFKDENIPEPPELKVDLKKILDEKKLDSFIHCKIIHAANLIETGKKYPTTFCKVKYLNQNFKSENITESIFPEYNKTFKFDLLTLDYEKLIERPNFKIIIEIISGSNILGIAEYNLKDLVLNKNKIFFDDNLVLEGTEKMKKNFVDFGFVYAQIGIYDKNFKEEIKYPPIRYQLNELKEKDMIEGNLIYKICYCRDLPVMDTGLKNGLADPYVIIKTPNNEELKTEVIDNNLNPEFNKEFTEPIKLNKMKAMFTEIIIKEKDVLTSDFIGKIKFNLLSLYENPNKWIINDLYKILSKDDKLNKSYIPSEISESNKNSNIYNNLKIKNEFGFIYLQMGFFNSEVTPFPKKLEELSEYLELKKNSEKIMINGTLKLFVDNIKGIISRDWGGKSDPYIELNLKGIGKKKTSTKDNTHDVAYEETLEIEIKNLELSKLKDIIITTYDDDPWNDEFLGDLKYDFSEVLTKKNEWYIEGTHELEGEELKKDKNKSSLGNITFKLGFWENNSK